MNSPFHVVAIGASAGGLAALEQFFGAMPSDSGMAFVVIQHLSPDFKSLMDDLLSRHTSMGIRQAAEGMELEPDTIYLSPPRYQMELVAGRLHLRQRQSGVPVELPIDTFFRSLAADAGTCAVGIVLSGTGSDGSRGIRTLRDAGGLVIVQSPDSAQFDGMPRNAIASGFFDFQLPPERMPRLLLEYSRDPSGVRSRVSHMIEVHPEDGEFAEVFALLRRGYNVDFAKYKETTINRRIQRRIELRQLPSIREYVDLLLADPEELDALYSDFLIGVTEFFRDPEAFDCLAQTVVPELIDSSRESEELRVWSACCATGEEAYSLAIVFAEAAEKAGYGGRVTIFATDVHKRSLEAASAGVYSRDRLANVSPERLMRFFRQDLDGAWRVRQDIRRMVVFAPHNVLSDPPFTKIRLVCCRNMLIYLQPEVQDKVISTFHYALNVSGVLFLGGSEGLGALLGEFEPVDAHNKLFRKKRDLRIPLDFPFNRIQPRFSLAPASPLAQSRLVSMDRQLLNDYDQLLDRYIPAGLLIDENRQVLHSFGEMEPFLRPVRGRTDRDLLAMLADDLHVAVGTTLQRAVREGVPALLEGVRCSAPDGSLLKMTVSVEPIHDTRGRTNHFFVSFYSGMPLPPSAAAGEAEAEGGGAFGEEPLYRQHIADLELELRLTRESLQAANEELQTSNEELQASNEELLASNEELQSTNEELHSVNEELFTVNSEFERKNVELKTLNLDHENLLASIDVGTVFIDSRLCIRKFNEAVSGFFRLLPQDVGRPIEHIAYHLSGHLRLMEDIRTVLSTGAVIEKEDATPSGSRHILIRMIPFRNDAGSIDGVVVMFTDITRIKEAELEVQRINHELRERCIDLGRRYASEVSAVEQARNELKLREEDIRETQRIAGMAPFKWNLATEEAVLSDSFSPYLPAPATGAPVRQEDLLALVCPDDRPLFLRKAASLDAGERNQFGLRLSASDGAVRHMVCSLRRQGGAEVIVGVMHDVTERVLAAQRLQESEAQLRESQKMEAVGILAGGIAHDFNNILHAIMGYTSLLKMAPAGGDSSEYLEFIMAACHRAADLTRGLLAYSRRQTLAVRPGDLALIVDDSVRFMGRIIGEHIEVVVEHDGQILPVLADTTQLQQVFMNLITNARDAMPTGGRLTIRTCLRALGEADEAVTGLPPGQYAAVLFSDTGEGMSVETCSHIFEPFFTTKEVGKGTGLGLAIVYGIVNQHGGRVLCQSEPNVGTEFTLLFPLTEGAGEKEFPLDEDVLDEMAGAGQAILLVEDEPAVRQVTAMTLRHFGYRVVEAADSDGALERFTEASDTFDLLITDVVMPTGNGQDLCRKIRSLRPDLPVLLMSGYPLRDLNVDLSQVELSDFIGKPILPRELAVKVRGMLDRRNGG